MDNKNINEWIQNQYKILSNYNKNQPTNKKLRLFFRGEPEIESTKLTPSIFRKSIPDAAVKSIYNEAMTKFYSEFQQDKTSFDRLVRMQHYGIPTKLLDITEDPMIALYFAGASEGTKAKIYSIFISNNNIVYPNDPKAVILSKFNKYNESLTTYYLDPFYKPGIGSKKNIMELSDLKYNFYSKKSILIESELIDAQKEINFNIEKYNVGNLTGIFCAIPNYTNLRIIRQRSAFIIGGLSLEDSRLKTLFDYKNIDYLIDNIPYKNFDAILENIKKRFHDDDECGKYLSSFISRLNEIYRSGEKEQKLELATFRELLNDWSDKSEEYLYYLLFIYGLISLDGKIAFYNQYDISCDLKKNINIDFKEFRGLTESFIFPDLDHYGKEVQRKYKLKEING